MQACPQGRGHKQPEGDTSSRGGHERPTEPSRPHERPAQEHAGHPPDHHADPHLYVGKPLILGHEPAGECRQCVGDGQAGYREQARVAAEGAGHRSRVAAGPHRRAEARAKE